MAYKRMNTIYIKEPDLSIQIRFINDIAIVNAFNPYGQRICECRTSYSNDTFTISSWFVEKNNQHKGYGRRTLNATLKAMLDKYGIPTSIKYIWNHQNDYVFNWLVKNFDAKCTCPIAILKNETSDIPEAHIYELNKDKVFTYFDLMGEKDEIKDIC